MLVVIILYCVGCFVPSVLARLRRDECLHVSDSIRHKVVLPQLVATRAIGRDPLAVASKSVNELLNLFGRPKLKGGQGEEERRLGTQKEKNKKKKEEKWQVTSGASWMTRFPGVDALWPSICKNWITPQLSNRVMEF